MNIKDKWNCIYIRESFMFGFFCSLPLYGYLHPALPTSTQLISASAQLLATAWTLLEPKHQM